MNLYEKLQAVQSNLSAPKNQFNKFGNYNYRNCEDIQEAVKPLLRDNKAVLVVGDQLMQIGDRYYIKATAKFIDCESGEAVENTAYAREEAEKKGMDVSQVTGSTSSYARKYALNGLFCIDDVEDADNSDNTESYSKNAPNPRSRGVKKENREKDPMPNPERAASEKIDAAKLTVIKGELGRTGLDEKVVLKLFGIEALSDLTTEQFVKVMNKFKATPSKEGTA